MGEAERLKRQGYDLSLIKEEHVNKAIKEIDLQGTPKNAQSTTYDLIYNNKTYPPKLVLSLAYKYATGKELDRSIFNGGKETACFNLLEALRFNIKEKRKKEKTEEEISFYATIRKFILQSDELQSLKTGTYPKEYNGLKVMVSFGKGNYARIPWISFLYEGQTTSKGIYPVFLYYKEQKILILSYGISETEIPSHPWNLPPNTQSIKAYFESKGFEKPERYGESTIYKTYDISKDIDPLELDEDLQSITDYYKKIIQNQRIDFESEAGEIFKIQRVKELGTTGLLFDDDLLYRYTVSLLTKPFVILSGLSGSGKTQLALTFAKWFCKDLSQIKVVSVGSDWNNREYLLGYPNALDCGKYVKPENGVLDFIIEATRYPSSPYFLILDEMNLSYVERYFADFLSSMESREHITLHPNTEEWKECDVPHSLRLPQNLYITGTINVDETTYMFSPKVLDRSNVIEFRITEAQMNKYLLESKPLNREIANHKGANMGESFIELSKGTDFSNNEYFNNTFLEFFKQLKAAGAEFGYRTASEVFRFIHLAKELGIPWSDDQLIDIVVMQKMLPKLHGSRKKMQPILNAIWNLCLEEDENNLIEADHMVIDNTFKYPLSAAKIWQMYRNAKDNGFTSYAEA